MLDILELMRENVKKINDSEQVKFFREVIEPSFKELIEHTDNMYKGLEENIYRELSNDKRDFEVVTALIPKKEFGYQSLYFSPICEEDNQEINSNDIIDKLLKGQGVFLEKLYLPYDNEKINDILKNEMFYTCTVFSKDNKCDLRISLELDKSYLKKEELLYNVFNKNSLKWNSINIPFSKKIVKVYVEEVLGDLSNIEEIERIEYQSFNYERNMLPIWNIRIDYLSVSAGVYPAEDKINYYYKLFSEDIKDIEKNILPFSNNVNIKAVYLEDTGDLKIICDEDNIKTWEIFGFKSVENRAFQNINLYRNQYENIFDKLKYKNEGNIKTKGEVKRLVNLYGREYGISLQDVKVSDTKEGIVSYKNSFITEENNLINHSRFIILYFQVEKIEAFTRDIIDFILAQVQLSINNYQCRGVIL